MRVGRINPGFVPGATEDGAAELPVGWLLTTIGAVAEAVGGLRQGRVPGQALPGKSGGLP